MAKTKVTIKKASNGIGNGINESTLTTLQESMESQAFKLTALAESKITPAKQCPQVMLRALIVAQSIKAAMDKLADTLESRLLDHAGTGGAFEAGKIAIQVMESSRRNVSWKNEAVELGEALAYEKNENFDKKAFETTIQAKYEPSVSKKIKLTESL